MVKVGKTNTKKNLKVNKSGRRFQPFRKLIRVIILAGILLGGWWFYRTIVEGLPNINEIYNPPKLSTKIYDRNGILLYKFYEDENRSWVPLNRIPQTLIEATIAIEDKEFFNHQGFSARGVLQAIWYDLTKRKIGDGWRGGSTITQQLVKTVFLTNEQTFERKIRELLLSLMIEWQLSKGEILERYFNQVAYGGEVYGVQEAAYKYFGKNVEDISLAEAAYLAGLPAAPSSYSSAGSNPEYGLLRAKHVLEEMAAAGYISRELAEKTRADDLIIQKNRTKILAPHFVFYVRDYLEQKFGFANLPRKGWQITTTLDSRIQKYAEEAVADEIKKLKRLRINNGAAVVVDTKNGEILAMVGSKDYWADDIDGKFNVVTGLRQPGSAIKPINYLLALTRGWTLGSTIDDQPVTFPVKGQKPYSPQNYNGRFMGRVSLRTALANSLNIPSVKLLASNGVDNMIDMAESMGITTWKERNRYGLALALGGGEVKMLELAGAYATFANSGVRPLLNPVLAIDNYLGEKIYQSQPQTIKVADPEYTYLINSVLSDNQARSPIFGPNSKLKISGKTVAVKTGTTNSLKDNWAIGWTPSVLAAAWVGNNDNSPMNWVASGVTGATPIWNRIMTQLLADRPVEEWAIPPQIVKQKVCGREEYFIAGTEKNIKCSPTPSGWPTNKPRGLNR